MPEVSGARYQLTCMVIPTCCAAFVRKARASGFHPKFLNLSFVGTADFIRDAGADSEGVYITQVVPSPMDLSSPLVRSPLNAPNAPMRRLVTPVRPNLSMCARCAS